MTSPSSPAIIRPGGGPRAAVVPVDRIRGILTWSADRESAGPRRRLQIALKLTWLLDAASRYQPVMFSRAFPTKIIAASAAGSPGPVASPVLAVSRLILHDPAACNAVSATIQLMLAAGLLWRPTVRAAVAVSVAWSLAIWWLGESLGGIFTGAASPLTGAPGAVLLYALLAIWVTGENFGGILTGQATDPNTGPLLVLLALAFWPRRMTKVPPAGS